MQTTITIILLIIIIALSIRIWYLHYIIDTWRGICMSWQYHLQSAHKQYDELKVKYDLQSSHSRYDELKGKYDKLNKGKD